jgi:site-specific DNA recombinase
MKAVGYIRVSTDEQAKNGWNLEADRTRIAEIADEQSWDLHEAIVDEALCPRRKFLRV